MADPGARQSLLADVAQAREICGCYGCANTRNVHGDMVKRFPGGSWPTSCLVVSVFAALRRAAGDANG